MKQILATCLMAGLLSGSALADIYIFNTTNDRFTYEICLLYTSPSPRDS